jgi:soluble lytic murein transglycosylase
LNDSQAPQAAEPVYERAAARAASGAARLLVRSLALVFVLLGASAPACAQTAGDSVIVDAREALRKKDSVRLAAARDAAVAAKHPLAMWADYFELGNRLPEAQQAELDAFYARWPGTYVEDRLRNDWLLELGKRRDWANLAVEFPRFRMNDDREVTCYALLADHLNGKQVREAALAAWLARRDADDGCMLMATTLYEARVFNATDAWRKARAAMDANRSRVARHAAGLVSPAADTAVGELSDNPARYLARNGAAGARSDAELATLALARMAANDPDAAAVQLAGRWDRTLPADLAAWAWAATGKQAALKLLPDASEHFQRAALRAGKLESELDWPDDTLAWKVRAALRADGGKARWQQVLQAVNAMNPLEQRDAAWVYWKARGLQALAANSQDGEAMRGLARELLGSIADQVSFYGKLANEELGGSYRLPSRPATLMPQEEEAAARRPGLQRALHLIAIGLRSEGVREWNFTLRGMSDRELLAAAQLACKHEVWDRCINTSERARNEVDMVQRFPMPFRQEMVAGAEAAGLDPAFVYGLIRQESRFVMDARSSVGASGLMQLMPATARWTARKIGLSYSAEQITDRDTNIKLGTRYLKLVLDDFDGSMPMATAAYNAGPGRPRRWREGPVLEPAAWAENIPFSETRGYVKQVLSNATDYDAMLGSPAPSLKARLGQMIGPRDPDLPQADTALP